VKRKKSSKPGKQKRMRMRSAREAGSRAEEPVDLSPSQPSPGSSRGRSGFGESVLGVGSGRVSPGLWRRMDRRR